MWQWCCSPYQAWPPPKNWQESVRFFCLFMPDRNRQKLWRNLSPTLICLVYTSNPSEGQSDFTEGCHEGAARGTTRGKVWLSRAWVGGITFFFIDNFTDSEGFPRPSRTEGDGFYRPSPSVTHWGWRSGKTVTLSKIEVVGQRKPSSHEKSIFKGSLILEIVY